MAALLPQGLDLLGDAGVVLGPLAGKVAGLGIGLAEGVGKGVFLRRVSGDTQGPEVFVEKGLQGMVGNGIGKAVDKLLFKGEIGRESCRDRV